MSAIPKSSSSSLPPNQNYVRVKNIQDLIAQPEVRTNVNQQLTAGGIVTIRRGPGYLR